MSGKETLYDKVTNNIIRELEAGVAPWEKPWSAGAEDVSLRYNAATNHEYSGINIPILWGTAISHPWPTNGQSDCREFCEGRRSPAHPPNGTPTSGYGRSR